MRVAELSGAIIVAGSLSERRKQKQSLFENVGSLDHKSSQFEEPDAGVPRVRFCGGLGRATSRVYPTSQEQQSGGWWNGSCGKTNSSQRTLHPMDWGQTIQHIRDLTAQPSEILEAILKAPPDQLPAILEAIAEGVRTGAIIITSYDWRPALNRLMALSIPWPGPQCQQCGSPLGEAGSDNNYGPGICFFCWEG